MRHRAVSSFVDRFLERIVCAVMVNASVARQGEDAGIVDAGEERQIWAADEAGRIIIGPDLPALDAPILAAPILDVPGLAGDLALASARDIGERLLAR